MSKLNEDILFILFKELQDDSKSLFSCSMVNRLWCESVIPILWKNPWRCYRYSIKKSSLYYIIAFYLTEDVKKILASQGVQLPQILHKSLLFDYLSFCESINVNVINNIISFGYSNYNKFILEQEFYNVLIKKCTVLKYLDMRSIKHQIFYFPEARVRLDSLCELKCDSSTDSLYFYGLSCICKNIQRLIIINTVIKRNPGIAKLIEVQDDLKYFEWKDDFGDSINILDTDPYRKIFLTLAKRSNTLNHLIIDFVPIACIRQTFLEEVLPNLYKLKTLKIDGYYIDNDEALKTLVYHDLEIFNIDYMTMDTAACIIENSGGHVREISLKHLHRRDLDREDDSLIFIRKIYENCPLIERLSLAFPPSKRHFTEFKNLLKGCQHLKSLLPIISNNVNQTETQYENGETILKILIDSAPINLREIIFFDHFKFSLEALEAFLKKWKSRPALSILTTDPVYNGEDYVSLIKKYRNIDVIKDFRCEEA